MADPNWLRYANQGATRSMPLSPDLVAALGFLPELGLSAEVFSGGQPGIGSGGARVGSTRHDHGNAADVRFYDASGRMLDWANPQDQAIFADVVRRGKAAGITGFGAGPGYMSPGTMHLGFGAPGVWGAGGQGANAPEWLRTAYGAAPAGAAPTSVASAFSGSYGAAPTGIMGYGPGGAMQGGLGTGPAAPVFGQIAFDWINQQREQQRAREEADLARRTALFAPAGGLAGLYG